MNNNQIKKDIISDFIYYNLDSQDIEKAKEILGEPTEAVQNDVPKIEDIDLSINQKMLIATYIYLYIYLHNQNIIENEKLQKTRDALLLSELFTKNIAFILSRLELEKVLDKRSPLEAIVNPTEEITTLITEAVFTLSLDSRNIRKKQLTGLKNTYYEHPMDAAALRTLEGTPALETMVRKFNEYGLDKLHRINITGSNIKVTEKNFPEIHSALMYACEVLNQSPLPELYIQMGFIGGQTFNVEKPIIVLTSGISTLTYDELLFLIGHEVGHIKSSHVLYHQMTDSLPMISRAVGSVTLGLGSLMTKGLEVALLNWYRKSEFTADRAGLLACQNIDAATTLFMKYAGTPMNYYNNLNLDEFKKQAMEFEGLDEDNLNKVAKIASVLMEDHPLVIMRAQELYKWIENGDYDKIIKNEFKEKAMQKISLDNSEIDLFCTNCGHSFDEHEQFCPECGQKRKI